MILNSFEVNRLAELQLGTLGIHHSAGVDHEVEGLVGPAAVAAKTLASSHGPIRRLA
jgi:hypothetical protein